MAWIKFTDKPTIEVKYDKAVNVLSVLETGKLPDGSEPTPEQEKFCMDVEDVMFEKPKRTPKSWKEQLERKLDAKKDTA